MRLLDATSWEPIAELPHSDSPSERAGVLFQEVEFRDESGDSPYQSRLSCSLGCPLGKYQRRVPLSNVPKWSMSNIHHAVLETEYVGHHKAVGALCHAVGICCGEVFGCMQMCKQAWKESLSVGALQTHHSHSQAILSSKACLPSFAIYGVQPGISSLESVCCCQFVENFLPVMA